MEGPAEEEGSAWVDPPAHGYPLGSLARAVYVRYAQYAVTTADGRTEPSLHAGWRENAENATHGTRLAVTSHAFRAHPPGTPLGA